MVERTVSYRKVDRCVALARVWRRFCKLPATAVLFLWAAGCGGGGNTSTSSGSPGPSTQALIGFDSTQVPTGEDAANGAFNIWTAKPDGSGSAALTTLTALKADSLFPVWSPDASKLAFVSSRALDGSNSVSAGSTANLWVMNADGSSAQPLTKLTAASVDFYLPSRVQWWSPDGSKLAFASTRALDGSDAAIPAATRNIWVINADGSGARPLTKLTASGADSFLPKWSPDGSKLAFSSFRALDGSNNANTTQLIPNVWIVNADGSGATPLTTLTAPGSVSWGPVWSPDGSKLAFVSSGALDGSNSANNQSTPNVWVINANGSGNHPLTKLTTAGGMVDPFDLSWSPDGNKIAFASFRALDGSDAVNPNLTRNIWIVNADGSGARPMTKNTAVVAHSVRPIWSPDGSRIALESQAALDGSDSANTNKTRNIWVINADGSGLAPVTKLTAQGAEANEPAWRP